MLTPYAEEIIGNHQRGFQHKKSTTDHIFCIHQLLEKKWEYNEAGHQLFIDFKKFMIQFGGRSCIILKFGIPMKMVRLIKMSKCNP
jgi:hypothetical protein